MRSFVLAAASLVACATPNKLAGWFEPTAPARPPTQSGHVDLVFGGHIARSYVELGVATTWVGGGTFPGWTPWSKPPPGPTYKDMLAELERIGSHNGCDAMLVNPAAYPFGGVTVTATCVQYSPVD
jgi:hypothetical protein